MCVQVDGLVRERLKHVRSADVDVDGGQTPAGAEEHWPHERVRQAGPRHLDGGQHQHAALHQRHHHPTHTHTMFTYQRTTLYTQYSTFPQSTPKLLAPLVERRQ